MKIGDYLIIFCSVFISIFLLVRYFASSAEGRMVEITGRDFYVSYSLDEERIIDVTGPLGSTRVKIVDGNAWIEYSPCREKICIRMGKINRIGEQIVCVPNRVLVEIRGGKGDIDGVSR